MRLFVSKRSSVPTAVMALAATASLVGSACGESSPGGGSGSGGLGTSQGGADGLGGSGSGASSFGGSSSGGASSGGASAGGATLGGASSGGATLGGASSGGSGAGGARAGGTSSGGTNAGSGGASAGGSSSGGSAGANTGKGGAGGSGVGGGTSDGAVRFIGRVDRSNPAAVKFAWTGTGFAATVSGSKLSVQLRTEGGASSAFFQPVIDGKAGTRFQVPSGSAQTVVLADQLAAGEHTVEVYRESEGMYGYSTFLGFVDGTVVGAPATPTRAIEIIGDSISAGYGNLGNDAHPPWDKSCPFSLDTQSAYASYGLLLGRALSAEVSVIAHSGWGVYRDLSGNTANVLSSLYANTLGVQTTPAYDFASRKIDAVVVNLGTNDSAPGDPGTPYEDAYVAFLKTVRQRRADAWIFLTIGPMTADPMLGTMRTHLQNVAMKSQDSKVVTVQLETQDSATTGCDYHPDLGEHEKMAAALKTALQAKLGW